MEAFGTLVIILLGAVLATIYSSFSWGFVSMKFYTWFVLPAIDVLPHFTFIQFVGFFLFLNCILRVGNGSTAIKDEYKVDMFNQWSLIILSPWLTLMFGYIIYSWFF